ncbi:MAG: hypothetical protein ACKO2K_10395, partial [Alphaproteobacteria bacterium]
MGRLRVLLAEPLLHFLLAGAAIFALYRRVAPERASHRIVVSRARVDQLAAGFRATWGREPEAG